MSSVETETFKTLIFVYTILFTIRELSIMQMSCIKFLQTLHSLMFPHYPRQVNFGLNDSPSLILLRACRHPSGRQSDHADHSDTRQGTGHGTKQVRECSSGSPAPWHRWSETGVRPTEPNHLHTVTRMYVIEQNCATMNCLEFIWKV